MPELLDQLEAMYGPQAAPSSEPYRLILLENVAYMADDAHRDAALAALKKRVGLAPEKILAAPERVLREVAELGGMHPEQRVERLRAIAARVIEHHEGDLDRSLPADPKEARRALKAFPAIGDPGADKILLFSGREPVVALESNGLRVAVRLGLATEDKSYAKTYKAAAVNIADQLEPSKEARIRGFLLLRRHGRELCKRSGPACEACPIATDCPTGKLAPDERG